MGSRPLEACPDRLPGALLPRSGLNSQLRDPQPLLLLGRSGVVRDVGDLHFSSSPPVETAGVRLSYWYRFGL